MCALPSLLFLTHQLRFVFTFWGGCCRVCSSHLQVIQAQRPRVMLCGPWTGSASASVRPSPCCARPSRHRRRPSPLREDTQGAALPSVSAASAIHERLLPSACGWDPVWSSVGSRVLLPAVLASVTRSCFSVLALRVTRVVLLPGSVVVLGASPSPAPHLAVLVPAPGSAPCAVPSPSLPRAEPGRERSPDFHAVFSWRSETSVILKARPPRCEFSLS